MITVLKLLLVNGEPLVKVDLPRLHIGDPVALRFRLERMNGGRYEVLTVNQKFRVVGVGFDASSGPTRQALSVEPVDGKPPTWASRKKPVVGARRLSPPIHPRTPV